MLFLAVLLHTQAQMDLGNLEFIENKGQWDTAMNFRSDLPNANFFLQKHGFSVLLQSPSDMDALRASMHGTIAGSPNRSTVKKTSAAPTITGLRKGGGQTTASNSSLIMHSQLYRV